MTLYVHTLPSKGLRVSVAAFKLDTLHCRMQRERSVLQSNLYKQIQKRIADLNLHETAASLPLQINTRLFVLAINAFRLLAGSAARACAVSTKLLSRRCAQVFRSLQIQFLQIHSLQPPVQLAGTWSLNVTNGPVGTRYCSFEGELRHATAYKADDRLAALQVPHAVLAMIVEALRPADQPAFRLVCSAWHQSLEIRHEVRLMSGWPELNENRISTIRQLLPKATVNMITAGRSEDCSEAARSVC